MALGPGACDAGNGSRILLVLGQEDADESKYPGPTAWIDVEEAEMVETADNLVQVYTKAIDDEDALLRQMASAAAPAPVDEKLRDPLGLGSIDPNTLKLVRNQGTICNCLSLNWHQVMPKVMLIFLKIGLAIVWSP